ncbi:MAG TPA: hypothetical protein HA252_01720 [Candidatus Diapherotrites archaeon]|uniref:Cobalamin-independent methionine synthase MetE C-terminal/archaeal domain-containing protein n=1 Tax=Candidatus Iainarchaeum sp. TaxID=3101447 RepID=A0A7J4JEA7_9ARCH|nr:hypothetical protein [Candidatus Diapherotrites archaeon]HIH16102.1 hypothetical protein [Candidatus Diapherotrites archaeon]
MKKAFACQEVGSIQRPIWRQQLEAKANKEWVKSAMDWGEKFNVEERGELRQLLEKDGSKRSAGEKQRIVDIASIYVIRMLEHAGLDRVFNGEQPRTEMYDMLAKQIPGIKTAGFVNSFDANYFRKGIIDGEISVNQEGIDWFVDEFRFVQKHTQHAVKPCFTGPYTMVDWSYVEYYRKLNEKKGLKPFAALRQARADAVLGFARHVLNPIVRALVKAGAEIVQIDEPAATTDESESALFTEAMNECFKGVPKGTGKAIHMCYSNYPVLFPELAECKADSYLIEFTNHASVSHFKPDMVSPEAYKFIQSFNEYKVPVNMGVGVIDIHSDLVESPEVIKERLLHAAKLVGDASRVQANPDCGLRTRRWEIAVQKLVNMGRGAQLAREALGE